MRRRRSFAAVSRRPLYRPARAAALSCLLGVLPALAAAGEIAVNIQRAFDLQASFADGIDAALAVDPAQGAARLLTDRLGAFSGGSLEFTLHSRQAVSILDPGVPVLPAARRLLLRADAAVTATGGLLAADVVQDISEVWVCKPTVLKCNDALAFGTLRSSTPVVQAPATAAALLQPIRLQAGATATPLADGVVLNEGLLMSSGTLRLRATFTAKSTTAYVADALQATAAAGGASTADRYGAAATDVHALRTATWTDLGVDAAQQARRTPELEAAQRLLAVARDSAAVLQAGATPGGSFSSGFQLPRQLWDVTAALNPALARSSAGMGGDDLFSADAAAELGVLRAVLQGGGDPGFVAGLADALAHPVTVGPAAALTLDGGLFGLAAGSTLSVYLTGDPFTGQAVLDLPNAGHHALWRTNFDRVTLVDGPAAGLLIGGTLGATGSTLTVADGEVDLGEGFGGLLTLSGGTGRIALNNAYGDQLLVVASWGALPVPEPASALLLAGGLAVVGLARRRRS